MGYQPCFVELEMSIKTGNRKLCDQENSVQPVQTLRLISFFPVCIKYQSGEDSDQPPWMRRLIKIFTGPLICIHVFFSRRGPFFSLNETWLNEKYGQHILPKDNSTITKKEQKIFTGPLICMHVCFFPMWSDFFFFRCFAVIFR